LGVIPRFAYELSFRSHLTWTHSGDRREPDVTTIGELFSANQRKRVHAIPAETADVVRLRDRNLDQPLYYRPTGPFGLFFVILDDVVHVLAIERRPTLRTEAGR
jgi:hypothetical protein